MISNSRVVVLCTVLVVLHTMPGAAQDPRVPCPDLPSNIRVDSLLEPVITSLLRKSETFRRQWLTIASARQVHVAIIPVTPGLLGSSVRAHATITRYQYGLIRAVIEIPIGGDYAELLPHEFEHVIEIIDGIDLARRAHSGDSGIVEVGNGTFETTRARNAGLAASREASGATDPAVRDVSRHFGRVWRAIGSRAVSDAGRRGGPASRW